MHTSIGYLIVAWLISAGSLTIVSLIVPGFYLRNFRSAMVAAVVVGIANSLLRPILIFLTLPLNILTLGLFTFIVDAIILRLGAGILKDFDIKGWLSAILAALLNAIFHGALTHLIL